METVEPSAVRAAVPPFWAAWAGVLGGILTMCGPALAFAAPPQVRGVCLWAGLIVGPCVAGEGFARLLGPAADPTPRRWAWAMLVTCAAFLPLMWAAGSP